MCKKTAAKVVFIVLAMATTCWAGGDANSVEAVLTQLKQQTENLKSYQGRIEYLFKQPILESETLRKGMLYYQKCEGKSNLKIDFQTLRQDEGREQKYIEQYIFDGVWLTVLDYQIKEIKMYQLADANEPADAFELVRKNFPIIGFGRTEDLKKEFEIKLVEPQLGKGEGFVRLRLKVKPDSIYKKDYTSFDFWMDKKLLLPAKIVSVSTEGDIYEIKLLDAKVNEKVNKEIFEIKIPEGFGKPQVVPLKKTGRE